MYIYEAHGMFFLCKLQNNYIFLTKKKGKEFKKIDDIGSLEIIRDGLGTTGFTVLPQSPVPGISPDLLVVGQ